MRIFFVYVLFIFTSLSVYSQKMSFLENNGLSQDDWKYVLRNSKATIYFYNNYFVIQTLQQKGDVIEYENIPIYFENKNAYLETNQDNPLLTKTYRFQSKSPPTISSHFESIIYKNISDNVDCRFFVWNNQLRFDFVVSDASVSSISLSTDQTSTFTSQNSRVSLTSSQQTTHFLQDISLLFPLHNSLDYKISPDKHSLIFTLKNRSDFAIIDPTFSFASFVGGSASEYIYDVKLLDNNRLYAVGYTTSLDFPTTPGAHKTSTINADVIVYAIDLNTNIVLFSTYLGGVNSEIGYGIDISQNQVIICGQTNSLNFPVTPGAFSTTFNGGSQDGFVAGLSLNGSTLNFSTFVGGSDADVLYKVATNTEGSIIAAGVSRSANFPIGTNPAQFTKGAGNDGVIVSLSPTASMLFGGTFLGGNNEDKINDLSISSTNEIVVVGTTASSNFPLQQPMYPTYLGGLSDAFVTRYNQNLSTVLFSTYYGGNSNDVGSSVSFDTQGNIIFGGTTNSTNLPTINEINKVIQGGNDVFIGKILPNRIIDFSTYLGGSNDDNLEGIAVNQAGNIYITGFTTSNNFPISKDAPFPINKGSGDMFISKLYRSGQSILYSTFYGDLFQDVSTSLSINSSGLVALGGYTQSSTIQTLNAIDSTYNGGLFDAFLMTFFLPDEATTIQTDSVQLSYCKGTRDSVSFIFSGGFERNNTFFVELSDSNGNFSPARVIGNLQSPNPKLISFFIPFDIPSGENYRIRIRASSPATIGTSTVHTIRINPSPVFTLGNDTVICQGSSVELGNMLGEYPTVRWFSNDTIVKDIISPTILVTPLKTTKYWASVIDSNGCSGIDTIEIVVRNIPNRFLPTSVQLCITDTFKIKIPDSLNIVTIVPEDPSQIVIDSILYITTSTNKDVIITFENIISGCRRTDTIAILSVSVENVNFTQAEFDFPEKQECEQYTIGNLNIFSSGSSNIILDSIVIDNSSFSFDSLQSVVKRFSFIIVPNTPFTIPVYFFGAQNTSTMVRMYSSKCVLTDSIKLNGLVDINSVVIDNEIRVENSIYCSNNILDTVYRIKVKNNTNGSKIISIDDNNITTVSFNSIEYDVVSNDSIFILFTFTNGFESSEETVKITIQDSICSKVHNLKLVHNVQNFINEYTINSIRIDTIICNTSLLSLKLPVTKLIRNIPNLDTFMLISVLPNYILESNTTAQNKLLLQSIDTITFNSVSTQNTSLLYTLQGVILPCNDTVDFTVDLNVKYYNPDLFIGSNVDYNYTDDSINYTVKFKEQAMNEVRTLTIETNSSNIVVYKYDSISTISFSIPRNSNSTSDSLIFKWGDFCNFHYKLPIDRINNSISYTLDSLSSLPNGEVEFTLTSNVVSNIFPVVDTITVSTNKYLLFPLNYEPLFDLDSVKISVPVVHTLAGSQTVKIRYLALLGDTNITELVIRNNNTIPTIFTNGMYTMLPICEDKDVFLREIATTIMVSILLPTGTQKFIEFMYDDIEDIQFELYSTIGQKIPSIVNKISDSEYSILPNTIDLQLYFLVIKNQNNTNLIPIYR